jgi:hypothetical protein
LQRLVKPTKDTIVSDESKINMLLDSWHKAADAKYDSILR